MSARVGGCARRVLGGRGCGERFLGILMELGLGTALIIGNGKAPWEVLANEVGPDISGLVRSSPLNFRRLEGSKARRHATVANGYHNRYGKVRNCSPE